MVCGAGVRAQVAGASAAGAQDASRGGALAGLAPAGMTPPSMTLALCARLHGFSRLNPVGSLWALCPLLRLVPPSARGCARPLLGFCARLLPGFCARTLWAFCVAPVPGSVPGLCQGSVPGLCQGSVRPSTGACPAAPARARAQGATLSARLVGGTHWAHPLHHDGPCDRTDCVMMGHVIAPTAS